MYCTKCGFELNENARFCSSCGNRTVNAPRPEMPSALMLDKLNNKLAGVCAGFARYLGVDVVLVRVLMLGFAICTGVGFVVYLLAWIMIPSDAGLGTRDMIARIPQTS